MNPGADARAPVHVPVMLREVLELLDPKAGSVIVDATVGGGGHTAALLERIGPEGILVGIDRDAETLEATRTRLDDPRLRTFHNDYRELSAVLAEAEITAVDGVLADLGISTLQLDGRERGFSFSRDEVLDMRMDRSRGVTAAEWLEAQDEASLRHALRTLGEERFASRVARALVRRRDLVGPIQTTGALAETVREAIPQRGPERIHPATRTFQAIRIAVNDELSDLGGFVRDTVDALRPGGRLAVISFHSLEDRQVKRTLRKLSGECTCPPGMPVCGCGRIETIRRLTRRALRPTDEEVQANPRSRSARLRGAERLAA